MHWVSPVLISGAVRGTLFPGGAASILDCLSSTECNAHLVAMVLDTIVAAILPELVIDSR